MLSKLKFLMNDSLLLFHSRDILRLCVKESHGCYVSLLWTRLRWKELFTYDDNDDSCGSVVVKDSDRCID